MIFTVGEAALILGARLVGGGSERHIEAVKIDSRQCGEGDLFVALRGSRVDGHSFVGDAFRRGASAALVERDVSGDLVLDDGPNPLIVVDDSLLALGELARAYRSNFDVTVIGVTGSAGKTTTKEMTSSVLAKRYSVLRNEANYNTDIGLPLTLFGLRREHEVVVLEMAMRGLGEIARLSYIARPRIGVITNIGPAHIERLGTIDNVLRAKWELAENLEGDGVMVINGDDPMLRKALERFPGRRILFGFSDDADVRAVSLETRDGGGTRFTPVYGGRTGRDIVLSVSGRHNVYDALAAAAVGWLMGVDDERISSGLGEVSPSRMRGEVVCVGGVTIIDDTYNANPLSMRASIEAAAQFPGKGRLVAVFGDMLELGEDAEEYHREIGIEAANDGVDFLITVGELARFIAEGSVGAGMPPESVFACRDHEEAVNRLASMVNPGDVVLVKGSRGSRMDLVVDMICRSARGDVPPGGGHPARGA